MPLDPNIILGIGDLNNPDRAAQAKLNALKLMSAQQEQKGQNALRQMFANPQNFDPSTGGLKSNALAQVGAADPDLYYKLAQNNLDLQKTQVELNEKYMGMIDDAGLPALLAYDSTLKSTGSKEAATQAAQTSWDSARKDLVTSGHLPGEIADKLPNQFNPDLFKAKSKQYQAFRKEEDTERHQEAMEALTARGQNIRVETGGEAGWQFLQTPNGVVRANTRTGEVEPVSALPQGTSKIGSGGDSTFTPQMGDMMAALAEKGVSLPTGFRSKQQQVALYKGLLDRNPGKTPDEIADGIKRGQIEFGAQKKETTTAAGIAGKVEVAANEIDQFIPLVEQASAAVPRGSFMPINRLVQAGEAQISDPNLRALKIRINSLLNAYDMLAARGGTDQEKRREVRNLLLSADSPAVLESALKSFKLESDAAHRAAVAATKVPELEGERTTQQAAPKKGDVQKGYRFKGGDPSKKESWEKVQ